MLAPNFVVFGKKKNQVLLKIKNKLVKNLKLTN